MTVADEEFFSLPPATDEAYWDRFIALGLHQPMSAEERAEIEAELAAEANGQPVPPLFTGLSHAEVLALEFPQERMLVQDLIPYGAVGTIAGVPETYKSWQAQTIAICIAHGQGSILGHQVAHQGPVGYFWQDDSTREEAERVKLYHEVRGTPAELPLRWYLNEGLRLPEHLVQLRQAVEAHAYVLVVLDSFYNILFGKDLKDEQAEQVIAMLKSDICDQTGCTVLIVDHMPWATDTNRQRLRSYGGVFKAAATRFGIYIDAVNNKLYVEARGNNITGFRRQPAEWDAEALELRLVEATEHVGDEEYEERILAYLADHPDAPTGDLKSPNIKGSHNALIAARGRLLAENRVVRRRERTSSGPYLWNLPIHAESSGTDPDSYQYVLPEWYAGTAGTPLRGGVPAVPPSDTPAPRTPHDPYPDIPF